MPVRCYAQRLLYPAILDEELIRAARVEAMMRKSQPQQQDSEDVMSTFYIEMGATGG
ncbi:MAG: hypothetical protein PVF75_02935 [Granulosicoccaceae bacterium]|jgi:hypothetical protein